MEYEIFRMLLKYEGVVRFLLRYIEKVFFPNAIVEINFKMLCGIYYEKSLFFERM